MLSLLHVPALALSCPSPSAAFPPGRIAGGFPTLGLIAAGIAFAIGLASPALAFEARRSDSGDLVRWNTAAKPPTFVVHAGLLLDTRPPADPEESEIDPLLEAIDTGIRTWSGASDDLRLAVAFDEAQTTDVGWNRDAPEQNENSVAAAGAGWDYEDDALAATLITFSSSTGEILDADILLNTAEYDFAWLERAEAPHGHGPVDLLSVIVHELGHAIGLLHSEVPEASMFAFLELGETWMADLAQDDIEGARLLYPLRPVQTLEDPGADDRTPTEGDPIIFTRTVGCSSAGPSSRGALTGLLLLLALAALLARGRLGRARSLALLLGALTGPAQAQPRAELPAAIARALDLAASVQLLEVQSVSARWEGQQIVSTVIAVEIFCLHGACARRARFEVQGGQVGDLVQALSSRPNPRPGDHLLVALPEGVATTPPRALLIRPMRRDADGAWTLDLRGSGRGLALRTIVERLAARRAVRGSPGP